MTLVLLSSLSSFSYLLLFVVSVTGRLPLFTVPHLKVALVAFNTAAGTVSGTLVDMLK